jgi:hypothetical protein
VSTEEKHFLGPKVFQIREMSGSRKCHYCKKYDNVKFMNKFEFYPYDYDSEEFEYICNGCVYPFGKKCIKYFHECNQYMKTEQ